MTSEIIKPDSFYAYITVIKQHSQMCLIPPDFFLYRASWNVDPSKYDGRNLAADRGRTAARELEPLRPQAFVGIVMVCELLNLSTCVLDVCGRKYWREMELPVAPQFIIPQHRFCIYDTTLEGWRPSRGWSNDTKSTVIGPCEWVMTKPAMLCAII